MPGSRGCAPGRTSRSGRPEGRPRAGAERGWVAAEDGRPRAAGPHPIEARPAGLLRWLAMITFEQVSKRYGERLALDSASWHMDEGECVVFLGHNGSGKTTILRLVTHEIQPTAGVVTVGTFRGGRLGRSQRALLRRTLGIIYEDFRLLSDRTVFENVALAVRIVGRFADAEIVPRVRQALDEVGLKGTESAFPSELSAGE